MRGEFLRKRKSAIRIFMFLCAFLLFPVIGQAEVKAPKKECHAYVVMDAGSGQVLFGQDYDKKIYPASTAKIMTAIVCLENGDTDATFKTQYDVVYGTTPGTYCLGIGANVKYSFKDLMSMSLISSAADATDSLAVGVFGSKEKCVEAMNAKCQELGLTNTHFDNPVGSDIGAGYNETYSTAREMALITRYAMSKDYIRDIVKKSSYDAGEVTSNTTNWFLRGMAYYDKSKYTIIGTKSGTTNAAGHVFIATAKDKEGHEVICAYFGNVSKESTFTNIRKLLDYTFKQYKKGNLTLTKSNYDVRCSKSLGAIYSKYAYLNCYPGENDGLFHKNRAITRSELGKMMKAINGLNDRSKLDTFISANKKGKVTVVDLAMLIQDLYPTHLSAEKIEEILADCQNTGDLTEEEKEAYAVMIQNAIYPDDACKNAKQVITRKEAVLFTGTFNEYEMQYETSHAVRASYAEVAQLEWTTSQEAEEASGKDDAAEATTELSSSTVMVNMLQPQITIVNEEWSQKMAEHHSQKEAERAAREAEIAAKKAAEEAASTTTEAATTAPASTTTEAATTAPTSTTAPAEASDSASTTSK